MQAVVVERSNNQRTRKLRLLCQKKFDLHFFNLTKIREKFLVAEHDYYKKVRIECCF